MKQLKTFTKRHKTYAILFWTILFTLNLYSFASAGEVEREWIPLFDGKTLTGWHQEGDGDWVVEEGAIVGKTQEAAELYGLLLSDEVFRDFTVRLKFKSLQGNSGFYIRMLLEKPDKAHGLQIEVDPRHNSGGIYESYRRSWVSQPSEELQREYFKPDQWNDLEITARRGDVTVKVNGVISAQITDDPSRPAGQLAMQMHSGNEMMVMFKDIEIRPIETSETDKPAVSQLKKIQPNDRGELVLAAHNAETRATYLPRWDALAFSPDASEAVWNLAGAKPGIYDVSLEWSADDAANPLVIEADNERLKCQIESTGSAQVYQIKQIGRITIEPGVERISLKAPPLSLRELRLVPASK